MHRGSHAVGQYSRDVGRVKVVLFVGKWQKGVILEASQANWL